MFTMQALEAKTTAILRKQTPHVLLVYNYKAQTTNLFSLYFYLKDGLESSVPEPCSIVYFFSLDKIPH
jgi:hypothetical protein